MLIDFYILCARFPPLAPVSYTSNIIYLPFTGPPCRNSCFVEFVSGASKSNDTCTIDTGKEKRRKRAKILNSLRNSKHIRDYRICKTDSSRKKKKEKNVKNDFYKRYTLIRLPLICSVFCPLYTWVSRAKYPED